MKYEQEEICNSLFSQKLDIGSSEINYSTWVCVILWCEMGKAMLGISSTCWMHTHNCATEYKFYSFSDIVSQMMSTYTLSQKVQEGSSFSLQMTQNTMKQVGSLRVSKMNCNGERNYQFKTKLNIYSVIHLFMIPEQQAWITALQIMEKTQGVCGGRESPLPAPSQKQTGYNCFITFGSLERRTVARRQQESSPWRNDGNMHKAATGNLVIHKAFYLLSLHWGSESITNQTDA